jgi:hypothetical protein
LLPSAPTLHMKGSNGRARLPAAQLCNQLLAAFPIQQSAAAGPRPLDLFVWMR